MNIIEKVNGEVKINIFPKQHEFIASQLDDVFFGGSVGGGKSIALLLFSLKRRLEFPGSHGLILRRTFRQLENSIILESRKIYPFFDAVYNEQKKRWTFPNGSIQSFNFCDTDADVFNFHSDNYDDICFDELSHFSEYQFTYITSRCRTTIPGCKALIRAASNPGHVGHVWCKKRYIDPSKNSPTWTDPVTKKTMSFIPSRITDNPALMENDPGYMDRLRDLPEKKFRALAEGDWTITEGQFFEMWDERKHVLRLRRVPDTYTMKFLSLDWGFADPACVLWWEVTPSGRVFVYRELYITQLHPKDLGRKIVEMSPENERYEYLCASPDIWGKKSDMKDGGEPIATGIEAGLNGRVHMIKAMNARVEGWLKMKEWMGLAPDGKPWMQISPNCENLIRTIPAAIYESRPGHNNEDMSTMVEDHALESCLVGETKVITQYGERRMDELVGLSGLIWTVSGWERFSDVRKTRSNIEVFKLSLSNGQFVIATKDHEIMTPGGWTTLGDLSVGDFVLSIGDPSWMSKLFQVRFKDLMEKIITFVGDIFRVMETGCTVSYGSILTEPYQAGTTFTTGIITQRIIESQICNVFPGSITQITIQNPIGHRRKGESKEQDLSRMSFPGLGNGICQKKDKNGIEKRIGNMVLCHGRMFHTVNFLVSFVGEFISQGLDCLLDFVMQTVKLVISEPPIENICVDTIESIGRKDVYNLEVDNVHCFSANGIIVHNCRYGAVSLMNIPKGAMFHPNDNLYDTLFGDKKNPDLPVSHLPMTGKSGY